MGVEKWALFHQPNGLLQVAFRIVLALYQHSKENVDEQQPYTAHLALDAALWLLSSLPRFNRQESRDQLLLYPSDVMTLIYLSMVSKNGAMLVGSAIELGPHILLMS